MAQLVPLQETAPITFLLRLRSYLLVFQKLPHCQNVVYVYQVNSDAHGCQEEYKASTDLIYLLSEGAGSKSTIDKENANHERIGQSLYIVQVQILVGECDSIPGLIQSIFNHQTLNVRPRLPIVNQRKYHYREYDAASCETKSHSRVQKLMEPELLHGDVNDHILKVKVRTYYPRKVIHYQCQLAI